MTTTTEKPMQKCHSIIVTGKVQDIGFRSVVEHIGRSFGMPGLVFNAKDGSVKILCCGEDSVVDNFTKTIRIRGEEGGAKIKGIKEILLPFNIDLPDEFSKVSSDDEFDLGRKLDKGNFLLNNMNVTLNNMSVDNKAGFNNLNKDLNTGFNNLTTVISEHNTRLDSMMFEQNARLDAHNTRLEAILEKLVNKS
jgi:acylphosphatase